MPQQLSGLANRFSTRAARWEKLFEGDVSNEAMAYGVISLYAEWEQFSRDLFYVSALQRPLTASGVLVSRPPGIRCIEDVDEQLRQLYNRSKRWNVTVAWGTPSQMIRACNHLALANGQTVNPAIQSQNSPADDVRKARNFLAHRNSSTALQVTTGPFRASLNVASMLAWLRSRQTGGRSQFGLWVSDMTDVARAAVQ